MNVDTTVRPQTDIEHCFGRIATINRHTLGDSLLSAAIKQEDPDWIREQCEYLYPKASTVERIAITEILENIESLTHLLPV